MDETLVNAIQRYCISQRKTLSLAESCTGGHLAARLTHLPGCSQYFLGSVVSYSNTLKMKILGVKADSLEKHGAVSAVVVGEMAQGVLELTGSDYSLAVTGIAGPNGGSFEKPVGTIWGAIGSRQEAPFIWNFHLSGMRQEIIDKSVDILLAQFWALLKTKN